MSSSRVAQLGGCLILLCQPLQWQIDWVKCLLLEAAMKGSCHCEARHFGKSRSGRMGKAHRRRNWGRKAANSMGCLSRAARTHCPIRSKVTAHRAALLSPSGPAHKAEGEGVGCSGMCLPDMTDV